MKIYSIDNNQTKKNIINIYLIILLSKFKYLIIKIGKLLKIKIKIKKRVKQN